MKKYYCNSENCKHAALIRSGDGWHEPIEYDSTCKLEDSIGEKEDEWTDNPNDEPCLGFTAK